MESQGGFQAIFQAKIFPSELTPRRPTHDFGFERRLDLPVGDLLPVDPPEELVALDVLLALLPASQTLRRVLDQKLKRDGIR